ncbi:MAG: phosphatidylglycerophosphatase A [Verrucomicrobiae bacterium]|nr:phosphatidylglycerophosphatase A [Verrucomicrobiae bacterium]
MNGRPDRWWVWVAEGFGVGRLRVAPGTWGSLLGVGWFLLLLVPGRAWVFAAGCAGAIGAAVWVCGRAERVLGRHDPGSVVLDEIVAVPLCFVPLLAGWGAFPGVAAWWGWAPWWWLALGFGLFRVFDIAKPWPVGWLQRWPGGWGIVADDVAAACWVAVLMGLGIGFGWIEAGRAP